MLVATAMSWCRLVLLQKGLLHKLKGLPQKLAFRPEQVFNGWKKMQKMLRLGDIPILPSLPPFLPKKACSKVLATNSEVDFFSFFSSTSKLTKGKRNCSICNKTLGSVLAKINEHPKSVATLLSSTKTNGNTSAEQSMKQSNQFKPDRTSNHVNHSNSWK